MFGSTGIEHAFWVCAIGGTLFFGLRVLLNILAGFDHGLDVDTSTHDLAHEGMEGPDAAFKLLSINSITGFFMMFGWVGLACYKQFNLGEGLSILGAIAAGAAAMYITASLFRGAQLLISTGSQFRLKDAIGCKGTVYQRIPAEGRGRIQIDINGQTHEIDAISEDKQELPSFKTVEVVRVVDDSSVAVKALG